MTNNFYINGNLKYYGIGFTDKAVEALALNQVEKDVFCGEFNLCEGDVFKLTRPDWKDTMGFECLRGNRIDFVPTDDRYLGKNICCQKDGRYKIKVFAVDAITIEYLGEHDESQPSLWQVAGSLANYDNNWGKGYQKIYLKKLPASLYDTKYSEDDYNCYYTEKPIFLEKGDELKLAIISYENWLKDAGATLIKSCPYGSPRRETCCVDYGEDVNGHNILIKESGKYRFFIFIKKDDFDDFRIEWSWN